MGAYLTADYSVVRGSPEYGAIFVLALVALLLYPLDTSKTRVQACMDSGHSSSPGGSGEGKRASGGKAGSGAGGKKKAKAVPWQEWFLSLYTGIETKALQTLVSQFLFFYTYEYVLSPLLPQKRK